MIFFIILILYNIIQYNKKMHPDPNFPKFMRSTLEKISLSNRHIDMILTPKSILEFTKVFTRVSVDPLHNNEFYEIIGDTTSNKIVVDYFTNKFKNLFGTGSAAKGEMGPVAIMSRLKQRYISKAVFSKFADKLGFWDFIRRLPEEEKDKTRMCEDAFEAFIGCLEKVSNENIFEGVGYKICQTLMIPLLEDLNIKESDLTLKSLYDFKSQLNNVVVANKNVIEIKYVTITNNIPEEKEAEEYMNRFTSHLEIMDLYSGKVYKTPDFNWSIKTEAETLAAKYAIEHNIIETIIEIQTKRGVITFERNIKGNLIPKRVGNWPKHGLNVTQKEAGINKPQIQAYINSLLTYNDINAIKNKLVELNQFL